MYLYPRVRKLREDKNYTQAQIGEFLGIDQRTYSNYEIGKRRTPIDYLIKLSKLYHTSIDYLVGMTDEKKPYREKSDGSLSSALK